MWRRRYDLGLRYRGRRFCVHHNVLLLMLLWAHYRGSSRMLVWYSCWIDSMIILLIVLASRSGVSILIDVHKDVLYLCLVRRIHDHNYWLRWAAKTCIRSICIGVLMWDKLVTSSILIISWLSESLAGWSSSCLFIRLLLSTHETKATIQSSGSARRCLSFWSSLLLLLLNSRLWRMLMIWKLRLMEWICIRRKVCMSGVLLMLLIPVVGRSRHYLSLLL